MKDKLTFRDAKITDVPLLRYWDTLEHVIDSDPDDDWEWELELSRFVDWRVQWIFLVNEQPMGFVQIIDPEAEETHYWGEIGPGYRAIDIWIGPAEFLGRGWGAQMMHQAIDFCFADSRVHSILIDPLVTNRRAIKFYQRIGFEFLELRKFEGSECSVHILHRSNYKKSH